MSTGSSPPRDERVDELDEFDRFFERALSMGNLSSAELDRLTDQLADGSSSVSELLAQYAPESGDGACHPVPADSMEGASGDLEMELDQSVWEVDEPSPYENEEGTVEDESATIGIVIDLHYLQVAASAFSLATAWSVPAFEKAVRRACGGGRITLRIACDSCHHDDESDAGKPPPDGYVCKHCKVAGHWLRDCPRSDSNSPSTRAISPGGGKHSTFGKARLHSALREAGYRLVLSPNKAMTNVQGATDVDVACSIFEMAGAFAPCPIVQKAVLVAGDADFKPVVSAVLSARQEELSVSVVAERSLLSHRYFEWLSNGGGFGRGLDGKQPLRFVALSRVLADLNPSVVDLRGIDRPYDPCSGRSDATAVARACIAAARNVTDSATQPLTLNVSGKGPPWGDDETAALVRLLSLSADATALLSGLWLHHTDIGDESCAAIASLLPLTPLLKEVHISDSHVSLEGVRKLGLAARHASDRTSSTIGAARQQHRLYVNARHLGGEAAIALAKDFQDCLILRLCAPRSNFTSPVSRGGKAGRGGHRSPDGSSGGKGSKSGTGKGGKSGSPGNVHSKGRGAGKGGGRSGTARTGGRG
ncbi:MAG: hypothetical protein SGPRY_005928 [Prymnesium sp.]